MSVHDMLKEAAACGSYEMLDAVFEEATRDCCDASKRKLSRASWISNSWYRARLIAKEASRRGQFAFALSIAKDATFCMEAREIIAQCALAYGSREEYADVCAKLGKTPESWDEPQDSSAFIEIGRSGDIARIMQAITERKCTDGYQWLAYVDCSLSGAIAGGHIALCNAILDVVDKCVSGDLRKLFTYSIKRAILCGNMHLLGRLQFDAGSETFGGDTAMYAGKSGNRELIQLFLDKRENTPIASILIGAARVGRIDIIAQMLEMYEVCTKNHSKISIAPFVHRDAGTSEASESWKWVLSKALCDAAVTGQRETCAYLRQHGAHFFELRPGCIDTLQKIESRNPLAVREIYGWMIADGYEICHNDAAYCKLHRDDCPIVHDIAQSALHAHKIAKKQARAADACS